MCLAEWKFGIKICKMRITYVDECLDERGKASRKLKTRGRSRFIWRLEMYGLTDDKGRENRTGGIGRAGKGEEGVRWIANA